MQSQEGADTEQMMVRANDKMVRATNDGVEAKKYGQDASGENVEEEDLGRNFS